MGGIQRPSLPCATSRDSDFSPFLPLMTTLQTAVHFTLVDLPAPEVRWVVRASFTELL